MTEEEMDKLCALVDEFYEAFSKLVQKTVAKAPEHAQDELLAMLSDHSSVYGAMR